MHCRVPNTFPTHNQTSGLKNQEFLPSTLDLEKCHFSQPRIGNKINQKQVTNHTLKKPNGSVATAGVWMKAQRFSVLGLASTDWQALRAFDKTIIFGHWLSKTQKLALASGAFLLKKASTISYQNIFKRAKIFFQNIKGGFKVLLHGGFLLC